MTFEAWLAFVLASALVVLIPGPNIRGQNSRGPLPDLSGVEVLDGGCRKTKGCWRFGALSLAGFDQRLGRHVGQSQDGCVLPRAPAERS